jgi:hypothetical protein
MGTNNLPKKEKGKYTSIQFLIENSAALAFGLCFLGIIASVVLQVVFRPPSEQDIIRIVKEQIDPIKTRDFKAELTLLAENADIDFQKTMINNIKEKYLSIVESECIYFTLSKGNVYYMKIAAEKAKSSIKGISIRPAEGWSNELSPYEQANIDAIERDVKITRIFIIPDKIYINNDSTEINSLILLMKRQKEYGTTVKYAFEDEIKKKLSDEETICSCALFDDVLFGYDIHTGGSRSEKTCFTWNKNKIAENIIYKIEKSKYVYDYKTTRECENHIKSHKPER